MRLTVLAGALVTAWACGRGRAAGGTAEAKDGGGAASHAAYARAPVGCASDPEFPSLWTLPEASAAVEVELEPGVHSMLVFADSGHSGEAMLWTIPSGPIRELKLALDKGASDDIEGAAWADGHLYTLTSSGGVRRYALSASAHGGLTRDRDAYRIGAPPLSCPRLRDGNCGNNYEGLCLRSTPGAAPCRGYAASKNKDALFCVVLSGDTLSIDASRPPIQLDLPPRALSDCAFGSAGGAAETTLLVTTNIYGGSHTYLVDEATGALSQMDLVGLLNNEGIAVDHLGAIYQFMDGDTSVSPATRSVCHGWPSAPRDP